MRGRKTETATRKQVVGYIRVSSEDQARNGVSLAAQCARIEAFAVATAREIDEMVVDAAQSAKTLQRPGMARILEGVRCGAVGTVIVLKLDRLTRSVRDLGDLLDLFARAGGSIVSVGESLDTSSAAGRMVVNMLGTVAQWEREAIAERTSIALGHKRREGFAYSRPPFGFTRKGDRLVKHVAQQKGLEIIRGMRAEGASLRQIAAALMAAGVPPARGDAWYASSVQSVLRSKMFADAA